MINQVAVVGAGTMGSGIALSFAMHGIPALVFDIDPSMLEKAKASVDSNLSFLLSKQKIDEAKRSEVTGNIKYSNAIADCKADLVIEAIVEKIDIKKNLVAQLEEINDDTAIIASNTSSLSISDIQSSASVPGRIAGMHFFNPAHVMKLVEVVKGSKTADDVISQLTVLCKRISKVPVVCSDAPGFIVNRVARHFYLEAMHLYESGIASVEDIDRAMELSGFKMGPFKLMDLIGMDINLAVSRSIYEAFNNTPRFRPSSVQVEKVNKGELGRKSGKGFYEYN